MRIFLTALLIAIFVGLAYLTIPAMHNFDIVNLIAILSGEMQSASVADVAPVVFVAPKGHFKVSFPGKPLELTDKNTWLHRSMCTPPAYFVADNSVSFWASERTIQEWEVPGKFPYTPITNTANKIDLTHNLNANNNDLAQRAMMNSPVIQIQNFLDYKCSEYAGHTGGKVAKITPCDSGGGLFLGQSAEGTVLADDYSFRMKMYYDAANRRIFTVVVIGKADRVSSAQATKFLDSLSIWQ